MTKYAGLGDFLRQRSMTEVPMTFADIERVTGEKLPPSAHRHRPWWSNNPNNSVMTKVWLDAGYKSEQVDMAGRKLVFRRIRGGGLPPPPAHSSGASSGATKGHPLIGALKGLLRIMPGTDLTKPADPDWGKRL